MLANTFESAEAESHVLTDIDTPGVHACTHGHLPGVLSETPVKLAAPSPQRLHCGRPSKDMVTWFTPPTPKGP